jgi:O-antigen biosynthesis protein
MERMKLSIITPTHNTKYLKKLEESISNNSYNDWEWIVLVNNGANYLSTDPRIRVIESKLNTTFVGALKKEACSYATGEAILEVDHDDMITPDCLEKVAEAFKDPKIGFVYSDNAKLSDDFVPYDPFWGWTYKKFTWQDKELFVMNSQPLTPGRLGFIWFAPDHIRAWRKDVYDEVGGHNENLEICDDQELMHKLYLVTEFKYIPEVLYIYRIDGENTWLEKNKLIQDTTVDLFFRNIESLINRFASKNDLLKIDLCGGFNKPEGYASIDLKDADIIADLNEGIPLPDNSCAVVRAYDAIEHLKDPIKTMSEIHRVLAPGGILLSNTPSTDGRGAWQDPTHVSFWNENSFWYWTRPEQMQYIRNDKRFFESILRTWYPSKYHKDNNIPYVQAILEKI